MTVRPFAQFALTLSVLAIGAASTFAASPVLSNIIPRGGQRGTDVEVLFNGQRLEDAQELMIYEPGIEVAEFAVVSPTQVKAKLKVIVRRTLRQFGYPPDMQLLATETVLKQAEMIADELAR